MAKRTKGLSDADETTAEARFRAGIAHLANLRKELKLKYQQELRDAVAEKEQREAYRDALIGRMLRQDVSPEAKAFVAAYKEQLTGDADRALFELAPLPTHSQANAASTDVHPTPDVDSADAAEAVPASPVHIPSEDTASLGIPPAAMRREGPIEAVSGHDDHTVPESQGSASGVAGGSVVADRESGDIESANATVTRPEEGKARDVDRDNVDGSAQHADAVEAAAKTLPVADVSPIAVMPTATLENLEEGWGGTASPAANTASESEPTFIPRLFLSSYEARGKLAQLGLKPTRHADGRWTVMASSAEQVGHLVDLGLEPYRPK